ncbi:MULTISPECIES: hypothetical protein [unclassified Chryseobacterium]|uniref:hypothetical protein n=1 Tax=unclassified Chryseobacterium TaxID=2593645 RepID=UPI000D387155|nr:MULTISPECIES: hypothetical protein [unclassified Chryseobacterium]MCQ4142264.1 hypothetical protein [Chryseobacterium sp. EO14]PTT75252.1 hypothetical protein DBR25_08840 [Chryseobacterium sp. HMWF001]PVV50776.1 hypothetical protein DD829_21470 [Chryseobacterium sp. HMWF035]
MKTNFQKEFLNSLADSYDFALNNKIKREELIENFSVLNNSTPFSERLNDWISDFYNRHKDIFMLTDTDDFDSKDLKGTLQRYTERFKTTGKIHIWTECSENTIFGSPQINHFYRAWHDHTHISCQCGFTFAGESMTAAIQNSMIPADWTLEKELIMIDIVGLNQYYSIHKEYVKDQRRFVIDYMRNAYRAIFTRQCDDLKSEINTNLGKSFIAR